MIRQFLPVGQGAFYVEKFAKDVNVVYDCGSSTSKSILEKRIKNTLVDDKKIFLLFISHFDEDHINGLEYILNHYIVENMVFPFLHAECKELIELNYRIRKNLPSEIDFFLDFLSNPRQTVQNFELNKETQMFAVTETNNVPNSESRDESVIYVDSGENICDEIRQNKNITVPSQLIDYEWQYVPFNFCQKERLEKLKNELSIQFGYNIKPFELLEKLISNYRYNIKKIKAAYKKIPGSFNTNSMVLFSGTKKNSRLQFKKINKHHIVHNNLYLKCGFNEIQNGCLYFGDYDASGLQKWDDLGKKFKELFEFIGVIQVPHHGSRHSYNKILSNIGSCKFYIISAGCKNKYKHPHSQVLKHLLHSGRFVFIVNEYCQSKQEFLIEYSDKLLAMLIKSQGRES